MPTFSVSQVPDMSGKTVLITGANAGIGYHTALHLAKNGAKVYLCSRSIQKGEQAIKSIKETLGDQLKGELVLHPMDLSSLGQMKQSADDFLAKETKLNILYSFFVLSCKHSWLM